MRTVISPAHGISLDKFYGVACLQVDDAKYLPNLAKGTCFFSFCFYGIGLPVLIAQTERGGQ